MVKKIVYMKSKESLHLEWHFPFTMVPLKSISGQNLFSYSCLFT